MLSPALAKARRLSADSTSTCRWLAILLLAGAALRVGLLVGASPVVAYANQYDQARTSDCVALWPVDEAGNPYSHMSPAAPRSQFAAVDFNVGYCLPSSAVAAAATAHALYRAAHAVGLDGRATMDIRYLGGLYAAILAVLVAWNHRRLGSAGARCLNALAVLLLLADPFSTLFFNTLYGEAAAVLGLYASAAVLLRAGHGLTRTDIAVFVAGILTLGASRPAHFALPLLLTAGLAWKLLLVARMRPRDVALPLAAMLAISVATAVWQLAFNATHPVARLANRTNAIMGALAPAADRPAAVVADLGMPPTCEALIGTTWFARYGHDPAVECPMLGGVPVSGIVAAALRHPEGALRAAYRAQFYVGAWRLPYVGEVEGERNMTAAQRWPVRGFSFADLWPRTPFWMRLMFYAGPLLFAVAALARPRSPRAPGFVTAGMIVAVVWAVSIFGDGYSELARHLHLAILASVWSWGMLALCALTTASWTARGAGLAALALGAHVCMVIADANPLARGYVEAYDGTTANGWIIASSPMQDVRLVVAGTAAPIALDDADVSADVARAFALPVIAQARRWHAGIAPGNVCKPVALHARVGTGASDSLEVHSLGLGPGSRIRTGREPGCRDHP